MYVTGINVRGRREIDNESEGDRETVLERKWKERIQR
jgi:hypothetical protein